MAQVSKIAIGLITLAVIGDARANEVREMSLENKVRLSAIVVIGSVISTKTETVSNIELEYARIRVDTVLKGKVPDSVDVLAKGSISEMDPNCCEVGKTYLFFLVKSRNGKFESANGPFGIYPIRLR